MTWPFENDTSAITKKLAKKSLQSEKRRNLMVVIAVALAAFLICFTGIVSTSLTQMQRNQVVDTYEAVWLGVEENDIETLKGLPEFERVGGYYMLGEELSEQGYHASYVYCDAQMMEIAKAQMELLEGRVPEKANEVVVSEYFLSTYGNNAKIGDTVTLDTESFHGDYVVTGIMDSVNEKEANTCAIILSNAALTEWKGFDPAGYRAYVHFKNSDQLGEELMTSYCREIAEEYQLPMPKMNSKYFAYASKSFDFALMAGVIAIVLIGGYIVIQSIFRISINDKIKSYGQLRTIGATPKQIKRIVKNEGRKLGSIGILIGTVLGVCGGFLLFSKGFNAVSYPYVWGGSSPSTSFDCSGFVSYVYNQCGWGFGRLGAQGLYNISTRTSSPKPGDLVFFTGTYDTPGISHVGIYVGDGWMLHCGDPISYANLNTSYWQSHFYAYGKLF